MELSHTLSEASEGLLAARSYQQPVSQQVPAQLDQFMPGPVISSWKLKVQEDVHQPWVAPDISQGPRETHETRGVLKVFVETCQRWKLGPGDQVVLLGYRSGDSAGMRVLDGRVRLHSRDIEDRAAYVVAISAGLGILYGESAAAENQWLRHPREILDGKSPLDRMLAGHMVDLIAVNRMVERERGL